MTGVFPVRVETHHGLIDHLVNIKMYDLVTIILRTYRDYVNAVTTDEIQMVAQKYVMPDAAAMVSDAGEISEQIKPFSGKFGIYDGRRKSENLTA